MYLTLFVREWLARRSHLRSLYPLALALGNTDLIYYPGRVYDGTMTRSRPRLEVSKV